MAKIKYDIVSSSSQANATVIEDTILIDCGINYRRLQEKQRGAYLKSIKLVLLTHIHNDHFKASTIARLHRERPLLRFGCCGWLVEPLVNAGISMDVIDEYEFDTVYSYDGFSVYPFPLFHNVSNCGYRIVFDDDRSMMYATDTSKILEPLPNLDLYMIEVNYRFDEIQKRIEEKIIDGVDYIYEYDVLKCHMSKEAAIQYLADHAGQHSKYVEMHRHVNIGAGK